MADKPSIFEFIKEKVSPKDFYLKHFPDMTIPGGGTEPRVMCVFHTDKSTPSLHFNIESGAFYCHGCEAAGNSIVSFQADYKLQTRSEAAEEIYHQFIRPIIPGKVVRKWHRSLLETPSALKYLTTERLLKLETVKQFKIGWTGTRMVLPICNEFGLYVNAKMYDPLSKKHGTYKMVNYRREDEPRAYGTPVMIYPYEAFSKAQELGYVVICEGEWDALFLTSLDIPAVTTTGGSKSWPVEYNEMFRGLRVVIAYDNDQDGMKYDRKVVLKNIKAFAKRIKRLEIPKKVRGHTTKDVSEWAVNAHWMRDKKAWLKEFKKATILLENPDEYIEKVDPEVVPLDQASLAEWYNKPIKVEAIVAGKDLAPYMLPKDYRVKCNKTCDNCPLAESGKEYKQCQVNTHDPRTLTMLDSPLMSMKRTLLGMAGFDAKPSCQADIEVTTTFNIEVLQLIPTLESKSTQYVMRSAYFIGHGLHSNRGYQLHGKTIPNPIDQHATHLFDIAKPVQDEIETFQLTPELKEKLKTFRPKNLNLMAHMMNLAEWQSRNITKIRERPDLHIAVDLAFHSTSAFEFNREYQKRGMLDVLVIGDTRCGKGYVTEGLTRYYGIGEVASGENCSFAGLIGGLQQVGKRWLVTWGLVPLNHRRLVVIDEASSLSIDDIGKMSRVRSEGVAEISKIIRESTQANTRLIWLANPRSGRPIMTYNSGIEAIKELVGANEDISRFDMALTVATNEVPSEIINAPADYDTSDVNKYPRELCRALVLWAWSRTPAQIRFTSEATDEIIRQAIAFGHTYSASIPLVQAENIRIKLAKISAAVAARVFSSDENGEMLIIDKEHVATACSFLKMIYSKTSMGYDTYSQSTQVTERIEPKGKIDQLFRGLGKDRMPTIEGLLTIHRVTPNSLGDYLGDEQAAKALIGDLVKERCLTRVDAGNFYLKSPEFSVWLRGVRLNGNGHLNGHAKKEK